MKIATAFFVTIFCSTTFGQIEKHLNEKLDPVCNQGSFLLGMALRDSIDFSFTLEDSERREFNAIIAKKIGLVLRKNFNVLLPFELDDYKKCVQNEFIVLKLVSYKETEVGGFEREGTIEIEVMLFRTPEDADPYKRFRIVATGDSDYGHSNPIKDAIEEAGKAICKELRAKN